MSLLLSFCVRVMTFLLAIERFIYCLPHVSLLRKRGKCYISQGALWKKYLGSSRVLGPIIGVLGFCPNYWRSIAPCPPPPLSRPGFPSVYPSYCCVLPKILKLSSHYFTTFHQYPGSSPAILVLSYQTCGEIPTGTLRASAV